MSFTMTTTALLFCAAVFMLQVYRCISISPPAIARKPCEYNEIKKCNHEFKQVFVNANNYSSAKRPGRQAGKGVYCRALQVMLFLRRGGGGGTREIMGGAVA